VDLRHQLAFLRSALPLMVIGALVGAAAAFGLSSALPRSYESQVTVLVGQASNPTTAADYTQLLISQRLSQTFAQLAALPKTAADVIEELGLSTTPEELLKHVQAGAPLDSTLLTITVEDGTPDGAARIADSFVDQLIKSPLASAATPSEIDSLIEQDLATVRGQIREIGADIDALLANTNRTAAEEASLTAYQEQMAGLTATLATLLSLSTNSSVNLLTVVNPAQAPLEPSSPKVLLNTILGLALGLLVAIGIAYAMRRLDDTIKTPDDIEVVTGLPLLGTIVRMPGDRGRALRYRLAALLYPRSPAAEGIRHVRTNLEFAQGDKPLRSLLVASSVPGEGKTVIAANLAIAFAQAGRTTCLIDADLRRPAVNEAFGLPNEHGLSSLLRGEMTTFESVTHETEVPGLTVMTTGPLPPNPAELLVSPRMRAIISEVLKKVDLIVLDSPPLQAVTDAAILSSLVDGTLLVTASGRTRRGSLLHGRDALQRVGARVLGTALNLVSESQDNVGAFAYFGYYGQAGQSTTENEEVSPSVFSSPGADGLADAGRGNGSRRDGAARRSGARAGTSTPVSSGAESAGPPPRTPRPRPPKPDPS
jgi:tyrosine-protein kinase